MTEEAKRDLSPREMRTWLVATAFLASPGIASGLLFAKEIYFPGGFVGDMHGLAMLVSALMLLPRCAGLLAGGILMWLGFKRAPGLFKIGAVVVVIASLTFIPLGVQVVREQRYSARFDECMTLSDEELQRLATEENDDAAQGVLAHRAAIEKGARYREMSNDELQRRWIRDKDQWAQDVLGQRRTMLMIQENEYRELSHDELRQRVKEDPKSLAWFELERRKHTGHDGTR